MSRILLIEDHAELRAATRLWLVSCGHDVTTAASGAEALQRFADGSFDLILSDIGLPDTDGVELLRQIRTLGDTPAISFSSYDNLPEKYPGIESLFAAHISKGTAPEKMIAIIRGVLDG